MQWKTHVQKGILKAIKTIFELGVIIIPIHILIAFLQYFGLLEIIGKACSFFMISFGLPGEASIAMVLGYTVNLYAAVGAASALHLSWQQLSLMGVMLCVAHSIPVEVVIVKKVGIPAYKSILTRFGVSLLLGFLLRGVFIWMG